MRTDEVERALIPGETIVWSGVPGQGVRFSPSDVFFIPFSIMWAGFAVFWESSVVMMGAPAFFALGGVPFLVVGAYITVGRFFFDAYRRSRSRYFLTDCRALILTEWPSRRLRSVNLPSLQEIVLTRHRDGTGSLAFGSRATAPQPTSDLPRFEWITDVETVYRLALSAQFSSENEDDRKGARLARLGQ